MADTCGCTQTPKNIKLDSSGISVGQLAGWGATWRQQLLSLFCCPLSAVSSCPLSSPLSADSSLRVTFNTSVTLVWSPEKPCGWTDDCPAKCNHVQLAYVHRPLQLQQEPSEHLLAASDQKAGRRCFKESQQRRAAKGEGLTRLASSGWPCSSCHWNPLAPWSSKFTFSKAGGFSTPKMI